VIFFLLHRFASLLFDPFSNPPPVFSGKGSPDNNEWRQRVGAGQTCNIARQVKNQVKLLPAPLL
jgi:hypothetical protein